GVAAGGDEASRRAGPRRSRRARQDRANGALPPARGTNGNGHAVACPLRALLDRSPRCAGQVRGEGRMLAKPSLTLKRRLKATPAQVFSAWADPETIVTWFGHKEATQGSVQAEMDVRAGGRYRFRFKTEDGEQHEVGGTYREVVANSRLQFTWAWHTTPERQSLVTVTMAKDGDGTMLT